MPEKYWSCIFVNMCFEVFIRKKYCNQTGSSLNFTNVCDNLLTEQQKSNSSKLR